MASGHSHQIGWVSVTLNGNGGCNAINLTEIVRCQVEINCRNLHHQPFRFCGAGDWSNPGLPDKQPGEGNLGRCTVFPLRYLLKQLNQCLVFLPGFRGKAGQAVAKVGAVERCALVDLSRKESLPQWTGWYKADSELFERRQQLLFGCSSPQRVFALDCRNRLDGVSPANGLYSSFREAKVQHLTLQNQLLHRPSNLFNRYIRVNSALSLKPNLVAITT